MNMKLIIRALNVYGISCHTKKEEMGVKEALKTIREYKTNLKQRVAEFIGSQGDVLSKEDKDMLYEQILKWESR